PEALAFARALRTRAQPEQALGLAPRPRHGLAIEHEVHEADLRRHVERLGQVAPGETPRHPMAPGCHMQARHAVALEDGGRRAIEADGLRPALGAAGPTEGGGGAGLTVEPEAAAGRAEVELQAPWPRAHGLSLHVRTPEPGHAVEDPRDPRTELGRNVVARDGLRVRRAAEGGEGQRGDRHTKTPERATQSHGHLRSSAHAWLS